MSKYHLKHQGPQIDALLDKAGTALQEHQDISHLAKKAEVQFELGKKQNNIEDIDEIRRGAKLGSTSIQDISHLAVKDNVVSWLSEKVDKIPGKQLTTEDFTTLLKQKLESLQNYDDTAIRAAIAKLRSDFDTLVESDTSGAIDKFNEIIAFLDGIEDSQSLDSIIASIEQQIAGKQSAITDLDTIRDGAAKGKTSVQKINVNGKEVAPSNGVVNLGNVVTELSNYYTKEEVNRSVGDLEEYTNEELDKKVGKGDIIPAESIGVLSNAANGSATSNPIICNRIPYLKADAFAFLNPDEYTIEYSVDGVDWEMADSNTIYSRSLFAGYNFYNCVPIDPTQRQFQVGSKIRITMYPKHARNAHIDVIAINMYCNGRTFDIEGEYCAKSNDTPQWQSMRRAVSSNANGVVYFQYNNKFAFEAYQRWGIRLTFTITNNTAYSSRIQGIMGYGNICSEISPSVSTAPYTLGTLWFWDYLKNITFPAAISATSLSLTGGNSANLLRGNGEQIAPTALTLDFTQLDWYKANTQSISNGMWQVLAPYIPTTKGNRLAFLSDEEFKVEYSTDSGVTWSEMEKTSTMRNVFSGRNNGNITVKSTTTDQMRITITPNSNRYCLIDFFYFWVGSPIEGNTLMDVEFSTGNAPDTWYLHVKNVDLRGLTGANMVKYKRLFAHGSTGVDNVRFTIRNTKDHNTNTTIQGISGYGTKVWGNMSNMFLTGDIYSWDVDQNAIFPSKIKEGDKWLYEKYALKSEVDSKKQDTLSLTVKDNGNIVIGNINGQSKEFMPATPSGDPMHYAYEAAGAVWNGDTGFWEYRASEGGLTDLTNEDMRICYSEAWLNNSALPDGTFYLIKGRTTINKSMWVSSAQWTNFGRGENLEVLCVCAPRKNAIPSYMVGVINQSPKLKKVLGTINLKYNTTNITIIACPLLEEVVFENLNKDLSMPHSKNISKDSILAAITKSASDLASPITITVEASAYERLSADIDIIAALEAHPLVTLVSA